MKYYVGDYFQHHRLFIFNSESFEAKEIKASKECDLSNDNGYIKRFLIGENLISLFDDDDISNRSVFIGHHSYRRNEVFIKKRYRILCFDLYIIRAKHKTFWRMDFNWLDYVYKALDPTWDSIDEESYDAFFKDFSQKPTESTHTPQHEPQ